MGKKSKAKAKAKKQASQSWCWYCDREFEDDKVLLQHQKAKHFRCPHCPRRLNTAGGLSVHIDQVHKLGVDKIENAIAGRDTFDVEIYGMEGIPAPDLAEWKKRKAAESGDGNEKGPKKPRINLGVISDEDLQKQLTAHKALMGLGSAPPPNLPPFGAPGSGPPGFVPPPGLNLPPGMAPPPGFPAGLPFPPPGMPFPPPGLSGPPGAPGIPPPNFSMPGQAPGIPPPSAFPPPGMGSPFPPGPGMSPSGPPGASFGSPSPYPGGPTPQPPPQSYAPAPTPTRPRPDLPLRPPGPKTLKPGQVMVYGDEETSPEEYRARQARYANLDDSVQTIAAESAGGAVSAVGGTTARGTKRARAEDFA